MRVQSSGRPVLALSLLAFASASAESLSPVELGVRRELNHARTDPHDFRVTSVVGASTLPEARSYLDATTPVPPLVWDERLRAAAQRHLADKGPKGLGDQTGSDGSTPAQRVRQAGVVSSTIAEEISLGQPSPEAVVSQLIIDGPGPFRPHRQDVFSTNFTMFGLACGSNARWRTMCVIELSGPPLAAANGETAAADQPRTATQDCPTWINSQNGVPVLTDVLVPPGTRQDPLDHNHASAPAVTSGHPKVVPDVPGALFVRLSDYSWRNTATGQHVPREALLPPGSLLDPLDHNHASALGVKSGHSDTAPDIPSADYVRTPCPPAGHR